MPVGEEEVAKLIKDGEALAAEFEVKAVTMRYALTRLWYRRAARSLRRDCAKLRAKYNL